MNYRIKDFHDARVLLCYRNFAARSGNASHVGLGVCGLHTCKVLRLNGIVSDVVPTWEPKDIRAGVQRYKPTHCIIEAPWIETPALNALIAEFTDVHFAVRCHSQVGFLQVEAGAMKLLRDDLALSEGSLNFNVASNSKRCAAWIESAYGTKCAYLPNLYNGERPALHLHRRPAGDRLLKIGSFGALRLLKNHSTAAAAAMLIARRMKCDLEFHVSTNRVENGIGILDMLRNMFAGLGWAKLIEVPWMDWPNFRRFVGGMDLNIQVSCTETFNIVSADSISEGIPIIGSDAIDWLPPRWIASIDDCEDIARAGTAVLNDPLAPHEGVAALAAYQAGAVTAWKDYLSWRAA